jgi:hypothetical protein
MKKTAKIIFKRKLNNLKRRKRKNKTKKIIRGGGIRSRANKLARTLKKNLSAVKKKALNKTQKIRRFARRLPLKRAQKNMFGKDYNSDKSYNTSDADGYSDRGWGRQRFLNRREYAYLKNKERMKSAVGFGAAAPSEKWLTMPQPYDVDALPPFPWVNPTEMAAAWLPPTSHADALSAETAWFPPTSHADALSAETEVEAAPQLVTEAEAEAATQWMRELHATRQQ